MQGSNFNDPNNVALQDEPNLVAPILNLFDYFSKPENWKSDDNTDGSSGTRAPPSVIEIPKVSPQQVPQNLDKRNKCPNPDGALCCVAEGEDTTGPFPDFNHRKSSDKDVDSSNGLSRRARVYRDYSDCVLCKIFPSL